MVNTIGGASAAQATYAATLKTGAEPAPTASAPAPAAAVEAAPAAPAQSEESAATARLSEQLNAQADASRVQRAVDEMPAETTDTASATASTDTATPGPAPAKMGGGGAAASSSATTDTDYIAEADTNSDKTVSDEERAVYEAKLREQNEKQAEVRAAYGQEQASTAPALDVTS